MAVSLYDRLYVSQYALDTVGIVVHIGGVPTNPDGDDVTATMKKTADSMGVLLDPVVTVFTRAADNPAAGIFEITFNASEVDEPGEYEIHWTFEVSGDPQEIVTYYVVGESAPAYDVLPPEMKEVVESVWGLFADAFDSSMGGPNLQMYFQANFGRGRIASLMATALRHINTTGQPVTKYNLTDRLFPADYIGVLERASYIEVIKHLIRSYVEQPNPQGVSVSYMDRRDYMDRWRTVLDMEKEEFKTELETFKIANIGLGRPRVLVAGGVYGEWSGPWGVPTSMIARPRYWWRVFL
jgi:hypothetical protein